MTSFMFNEKNECGKKTEKFTTAEMYFVDIITVIQFTLQRKLFKI